jgi:flagellar biogenesis protein FliO
MPEDKEKSQLPTLISILSLFIALLLVIFFIVPKTSEIQAKSSEVLSKSQELELGKQKVVAIREAVKLIATAKKEVAALDVSIPQTPSADEALVQIQEMSSKSETTISEATVGSAAEGYQDLTATISGSYPNLLSFLEKIQNNLRPIKVDNLNMSINEESGDITMSLSMKFPYLEPAQEDEVAEGEGSDADEAVVEGSQNGN